MDRHIKALDGLRGAAVVAVLLFHAGHLTGGYLGVDLFFVLSGFLITSLLLGERRKTDRIDLKAFWVRRARRLLPALYALLVGVSLYAMAFATPEEVEKIRNDALAAVAYVANWSTIFGSTGYFDQFAAPSPLQHTWSLAIEEQFYVIWPLVAVLVISTLKLSSKVFMWICITLAALSFGLMLLFFTPDADPTRVYMGTDTRASSILIGAAIACAVATWGHTTNPTRRIALEVAGWVAVLGLAVAWGFLDGSWNITYQGGLLACGLGAGLVIANISHPEPGLLAKALSFPPLVYLGTISYGLYLWHWPIYLAMNEDRTGLDGWLLTVARLAVSFAMAIGSFYLLEKPIRNGALSKSLTPRWAAITAPIGAALVCILLVVVAAVVGTPSQDSALAQGPVAANAPKVLFVGDSGAEQLAERFDEIKGDVQLQVDNKAVKGCRLFRGEGSSKAFSGNVVAALGGECGADMKAIAAASKSDVALVHMAGPALGLVKVDGDYRSPCDEPYRLGFERRLRDLVTDISAAGTKVLLTTTPEIDAKTFKDRSVQDQSNQATACVNASIRAVQASMPAVSALIDLRGWICPDGACRTTQEAFTLRDDGVHFKGAGGRVAARWLANEIRTRLPSKR